MEPMNQPLKFRRGPPQQPGSWRRLLVYICLCWTGIDVVLWIVLLGFPGGWNHKVTLFYCMDISLWRVKLSKGVAQAFIAKGMEVLDPDTAEKIKDWGKNWVFKQYTLPEFKERMCALTIPGHDVCSVWTQIQWGNWMVLVASFAGILCMVIGAFLLWFYSFISPEPGSRKCAGPFLSMGPAILFAAIVIYMLLTMPLAEFIPFGPLTWGPCTVFALFHSLLCTVPSVIMLNCLNEQTAEEITHESRRAEADHAREVQLATMEANVMMAAAGLAQAPPSPGGVPVAGPQLSSFQAFDPATGAPAHGALAPGRPQLQGAPASGVHLMAGPGFPPRPLAATAPPAASHLYGWEQGASWAPAAGAGAPWS